MIDGHAQRPRPGRAWLGFAAMASDAFDFLRQEGFKIVEMNDTLVRYESNRRFVVVFHGLSSYELGVEFGRWVQVNGQLHEQAFSLADVIELHVQRDRAGYGGMTATEPELLQKFLNQLASLTRQFATRLLSEGDDIFEQLSERNAQRSEAYLQGVRAGRLRAQAAEAWRRHDLGKVVNVYSEIEVELPTVELKPSERARLRYARRAISGQELG